MGLNRVQLIGFAVTGSVVLLAGAFAFEFLGGLAPCQLCLWQRWPHAAAILIGLAALVFNATGGVRMLAIAGAIAVVSSAAIGMFHVGVEQKWWEGLASCTAGSVQGLSGAELLNTDVVLAPVVRCDAIAWALFGVSMAGWNVLISLGLAVIWLQAVRLKA